MRTLLIDNYDSYTYNLYQMLAQINGIAPVVIHNDAVAFEALKLTEFDNIVISPGPGHPENDADFGVCSQVLLEAEIPILGVCLGHQGMAQVFGGEVIHAPVAIHGRRSAITHHNTDVFANIPQGFKVVRYHSLVVSEKLPDMLEKTAWTSDGIIMGLRHKSRPIWGVQFHPESINTEYGQKILENFRDLTVNFNKEADKVIATDNFDKRQIPVKVKSKVQYDYNVQIRKLDQLYDPENTFFQQFKEKKHAFWLDSSRAEVGMARFSFIGTSDGPYSQIVKYDVSTGLLDVEKAGALQTYEKSIYDYLDEEICKMHCETDVPFDFNTGFIGYFGYELKSATSLKSTLPDAYCIFADRLLVFDHLENKTYLACFTEIGKEDVAIQWFDEMEKTFESLPPLPAVDSSEIATDKQIEFHLRDDHDAYIANIGAIQQQIIDGETYEITLTNEITTKLNIDSLTLYRNLRKVNPAPYAAYLSFDGVDVLCSSPERFVKVDRERSISAKPIKGTIKRGLNKEEDLKLFDELKDSEKNQAENLMIVDLLRNDLGVVCEVGSVQVPKLMDVETYETVHQLVSTITGQIRADMTSVSCVEAASPGGSMTGAPKKRSMQIIAEVEKQPRGVYSGSIGYFGLNGTADLNIVIRTIVIDKDILSIGVGGAITMLSDAEGEYDEMLLKAKALLKAIVFTATGSFKDRNYVLIGDQVSIEEY